MARELSQLHVLTQDVKNPRPDARKRANDFSAIPMWKAGTVVQLIDTDEWMKIFPEWNEGNRLVGEIENAQQIRAILPFLRLATEEDALRAMFEDAPSWAQEAIRGKLALIRTLV